MDYMDVKAFFVQLAADNGWGLSHNSEHLELKIGSEKAWMNKLILVMDEPQGRLRYTGSFYDSPTYGFWLLKKVQKGTWEPEDQVYQEAKTAMLTILSAMNAHMEAQTGVFWGLDPNSVDYRKAGPLTQERLFGIYCSVNTIEGLGVE